MQRILLTFLLACSAVAAAAEIVRCGKDDFGNIVCLDKDGVVAVPPKATTGVGAASAVPAAASGAADPMDWLRCATDPFGNKVCRP